MNETARAQQFRRRAHHLRHLAETIEASPVMQLDLYAGPETWRGVRPELCRTTLTTNQHQLHAAAEDLRAHAYGFEQQAQELEAIARAQVGLAG